MPLLDPSKRLAPRHFLLAQCSELTMQRKLKIASQAWNVDSGKARAVNRYHRRLDRLEKHYGMTEEGGDDERERYREQLMHELDRRLADALRSDRQGRSEMRQWIDASAALGRALTYQEMELERYPFLLQARERLVKEICKRCR